MKDHESWTGRCTENMVRSMMGHDDGTRKLYHLEKCLETALKDRPTAACWATEEECGRGANDHIDPIRRKACGEKQLYTKEHSIHLFG